MDSVTGRFVYHDNKDNETDYSSLSDWIADIMAGRLDADSLRGGFLEIAQIDGQNEKPKPQASPAPLPAAAQTTLNPDSNIPTRLREEAEGFVSACVATPDSGVEDYEHSPDGVYDRKREEMAIQAQEIEEVNQLLLKNKDKEGVKKDG
jgi:hypothetical protein